MVVAPVDGVLLEVRERVVHPAHVPFEAEAQPTEIRRLRYAGPCGRLLGGGRDAGLPGVGALGHALEELAGLEVLAPAVLVRQPLAVFAPVGEVEPRRDGVGASAE